jgi:hypothetical protein
MALTECTVTALVSCFNFNSRKYSYLVTTGFPHPKDVRNIKNLQAKFLPANTTPVLQSVDHGITKALKQTLHQSFVLRLLQRLNLMEDSYKISSLDAASMLMAWNSVCNKNTPHCSRKAGVITNAESEDKAKDGDDEARCDARSNLKEKLNIRSTFGQFVEVDNALSRADSLDQLC